MANEFKVKNGLIVIGDLTTSGTITINGALAATQSWVTSQAYLTSASLSGYATQSYVTSALAALVDAAPAALDTLNELAAALGDDANFSTTITNSIAAKLPLAGGTLTGALNGTSASFSSNVTLGNNADLVFQDLAGTFPTSGKGFDWTLNNDGARIYAIQPNSDSIDFVFQLRDNATTNDRFVFWVAEWQGPAYDKYPLIISGGTQFDLKDSALYTNTVLRLSNSGVLQNVTGNISMFTNNAGYLTSYTETDTLATVTGRGASTSTNISVNTINIGTDATYGGAYRSVSFGYNGDGSNRILAANNTSDGMYFMAATGHGFNFRPNGGTANLVVINSAGNLGIGTTSPSAKIHIVPTGIQVGLIADGTSVPADTANKVLDALYNGGSSAFSVRSNGLVYIGYDSMYVEGAGITRRYFDSRIQFGTADLSSSTTGANVEVYGGLKVFRNVSNSSTSEIFRITNGGNVGIGTTTPTENLVIGGGGNVATQVEHSNVGWFRIKNTSTGNYWHMEHDYGDNDLRFGTSVSNGMLTLLSSGNIGIGTTSPLYKLDVVGAIRSNASNVGTLNLGTDSYSSTYLTAQVIGQTSPSYTSTGKLSFKVLTWGAGSDYGPTEQMYIDVTGPDTKTATLVMLPWGGNVGIGTTSPSQKLNIEGNILLNLGGTLYLRDTTTYINEGSGLNLVSGATRSINLSAGGSERMRITATGDVGIGTSSPGAKLHVVGKSIFENNMRIYPASESWAEGLSFIMPTTVNWGGLRWQRQRGNNDGNWYVGFTALDSTDDLVFGANNGGSQVDNIIRLTKAGSVGIGTSSPSTKLDVNGVITATGGNSTNWNTAYSWGNHATAGYLTSVSDIWVNTAGDTMSGTLSFQQPVGLSFANGQYIKDNNSGGLIINSGAAVNINGTSVTINGNTVWHSGNDGSGSGLDADLLDGVDSGSFLRSDVSDSFSGTLTMATQRAFVPSNYGHGVYGLYSAERYQHVWSMGAGYDLPADGASNGNGGSLYGLAWSYNPDYSYVGSNAQSKPGLNHQLLLMMNGITYTALGNGIWTSGTITTTSHGNSSQWNTAYSWGNHASAGYQPASTAITTSNIGSQSVSYANSAGYAGYVNNQSGQLVTYDNRTISPSETNAGYLQFGFTSWDNNGGSPYADYLHMRSYTDGSGGNDNLVMFLKSGIGMRIYQQTFGSATAYSSYVDVWTTANFTSTNVSNWNTAYSWGNHASASYATTSYVTTQINNLINGAPGVLDTLDELAAALGDDANFATTVTNSIAGKVSKTGDTMTGALTIQNGVSATWDYMTLEHPGPHARINLGNAENGFLIAHEGTTTATFATNGNLTITGALIETSSIKVKENVKTSEGNLEKVVNLRPVTYNKIGSQTKELGLIAEEVAEVYPEFVQYDENGEPIGVNYSRLTAALIGAVKELTNQVQELNKKING